MRSGNLRHHIRIDRAPKPWPKDAAGQPIADAEWDLYSQPWADIQPASAREIQAAGLTVARETVSVLLRYSESISAVTADEEWRVLWRGRYYDIKHADPRTGRHKGEAYLICEARADA